MSRSLASIAIIVASTALAAQPHSTNGAFPLTVDSIMRGPALVGYPPERPALVGRLHSELYFEWRHPGEDEAATWVVGREGGRPARLSDDERLNAPLPAGQWDAGPAAASSASTAATSSSSTRCSNRRIEITRTTGDRVGAALGARRDARHLRPRQQPVRRAGRHQRRRRHRAADRRVARRAESRAHRQPAHPRRRRRTCSTGSSRSAAGANAARHAAGRGACRGSSSPSGSR